MDQQSPEAQSTSSSVNTLMQSQGLHRDVSVIQVGAHNTGPKASYLSRPAYDDSNDLSISPSSNLVIPAHIIEEEDERTFKCCDCDRFITHCFFVFACIWFMIASSFARIIAIFDIVSHILVYIIEIAAGDAFFESLKDDWQHFQYRKSCLDLLILSLLRTIACYWLYAYKRQLDSHTVVASFVVMAVALIYCFIKIFLVQGVIGARFVAIFSCVYTVGEWLIYTFLRRRRVLVEQTNRQLDLDVDIESGSYIYYNNQHANTYQSPLSPATKGQGGNFDGDGENLFTLDALDGPGTNAGYDGNSNSQGMPLPDAGYGEIALPVGDSRPRVAAGARRHKSTKTMRIGGVARSGPASPSSLALDAHKLNHTASQQNVFNQDALPMYTPFPHHAIQYPIQVPESLSRLSHPNSQFLSFEDVRIHYKFIVNPRYKPYFDKLYEHHGPAAPYQTLPQNFHFTTPTGDEINDVAYIPPCLVLIHGFIGSLYNWENLVSLLGNYSAILIFDRPGFGLSTMLTEDHITMKEYKFRTQQQRLTSIQSEVSKLNTFLQSQAQPTTTTTSNTSFTKESEDPFLFTNPSTTTTAAAPDSTGSTPALSTTSTTASTTSAQPMPPQLMANVYDYYSLINAFCPDFHPYRSQFTTRLISTFLHIYKLSHLGVILGGHHSGGTLALSTVVEFTRIYQQINANPTLQQSYHQYTSTHSSNNLQGVNGTSTGQNSTTTSSNTAASKALIQSPIRGVILFACSIYDDGFPPLIKNIFSTKLGKSMVQSLLNSEGSEMALKRAFFNPEAIPPGLIKLHKAINKYIPHKDDAFYTMAMTECQNNDVEIYVNHIKSLLYTISAPVLVLHGEEDKIVPVTSTNRLIRSLSGSNSIQCVRIAQCGHLLQEETPGTVATSLDSFLLSQTRYKIYQHNQNKQ